MNQANEDKVRHAKETKELAKKGWFRNAEGKDSRDLYKPSKKSADGSQASGGKTLKAGKSPSPAKKTEAQKEKEKEKKIKEKEKKKKAVERERALKKKAAEK